MLHEYDQRFNVMRNLENFCKLNKALLPPPHDSFHVHTTCSGGILVSGFN